MEIKLSKSNQSVDIKFSESNGYGKQCMVEQLLPGVVYNEDSKEYNDGIIRSVKRESGGKIHTYVGELFDEDVARITLSVHVYDTPAQFYIHEFNRAELDALTVEDFRFDSPHEIFMRYIENHGYNYLISYAMESDDEEGYDYAYFKFLKVTGKNCGAIASIEHPQLDYGDKIYIYSNYKNRWSKFLSQVDLPVEKNSQVEIQQFANFEELQNQLGEPAYRSLHFNEELKAKQPEDDAVVSAVRRCYGRSALR